MDFLKKILKNFLKTFLKKIIKNFLIILQISSNMDFTSVKFFFRNLKISLQKIWIFSRLIKLEFPIFDRNFFQLSLEEAAKQLAARTPGMSGADLANVCNEGALIAARAGQKQINFIVSHAYTLFNITVPSVYTDGLSIFGGS